MSTETILLLSLAAAGAIMLAAASLADAHEAPTGWNYPLDCCAGVDCREVSSTAISERPEGYVITATGEVVGYQDSRVRNSPDGVFHWCSVAGLDDSRTICLFVPTRAF